MQPTLPEGSEVLVSSIPYFFTSPKKGDIVAFKLYGKILIKRIKMRKSEKYYLVGDNGTDSLDSKKLGWVDRKEIMGKIIGVIGRAWNVSKRYNA